MTKGKQFLFTIDDEEKAMLLKVANDLDRPMSWVLRKMIRTLYDRASENQTTAFQEFGLK